MQIYAFGAYRAVSVLLGSSGILCLVASFRAPRLGAYAFIMLAAATVMVVALDKKGRS